jgi:hypothetical protein
MIFCVLIHLYVSNVTSVGRILLEFVEGTVKMTISLLLFYIWNRRMGSGFTDERNPSTKTHIYCEVPGSLVSNYDSGLPEKPIDPQPAEISG